MLNDYIQAYKKAMKEKNVKEMERIEVARLDIEINGNEIKMILKEEN